MTACYGDTVIAAGRVVIGDEPRMRVMAKPFSGNRSSQSEERSASIERLAAPFAPVAARARRAKAIEGSAPVRLNAVAELLECLAAGIRGGSVDLCSPSQPSAAAVLESLLAVLKAECTTRS